ncbi:MAG: hypothetical protein WB502_14680 [Thermoactinomyces sp.]
MKQKIFSKVAVDMYKEQMKWTFWFLLFILAAQIVHVILVIFPLNIEDTIRNFLPFLHGSAKIYMLIIGIFSYGFLTFYVTQGVTRRDYFIGSSLAALGLSITMIIIGVILSGLQFIILDRIIHYPAITLFENYGVLQPIYYNMNIFIFYLIGYLIGIGYYRFGWIIGFAFVAFAILSIILTETLLKSQPAIAFTGLLALTATILIFIRQITKRMAVKV